MHNHYKDILDRIAESPTWFDDDGVPRFGAFSPNGLGNIYAREAALAEISCQGCGRRFRVALTDAFTERRFGLCDAIRLRRADYGDPPNMDCCAGGPTMSSVTHAILEYWFRDTEIAFGWMRDPGFEGPVAEGRLDAPDTVAAVLAAVGADRRAATGKQASEGKQASDRKRAPGGGDLESGGRRTVHVACTSRRNRYDLAGRITAALEKRGRVLVVFPANYVVVAFKMLNGLVPDEDVGNRKDACRVTLISFHNLDKIGFATFDALVVLAGPRPKNKRSDGFRDEDGMTSVLEQFDGIRIELLLPHSRPVLPLSDLIVDAAVGAGPRPDPLITRR